MLNNYATSSVLYHFSRSTYFTKTELEQFVKMFLKILRYTYANKWTNMVHKPITGTTNRYFMRETIIL